ncbi:MULTISPECIES: oligosaccharide flippase family protein [Pseudomonas]|uniref:oligosaccharide flippase family protein n=1 Tax=Pseudomonas TaxID=286 RepID=UPI000D4C60DC|nr:MULTISPECIES: oligosaccharide flippase family protein [Pseudomonas]PRW76675.1 O-antigen flippase [Pseudomonas fluorescens]
MKSIVNVGFQAIIKLLFSVVSLKIVAYYAGPSGMAVVGQLQSFLQMAGAGASAMSSTGVVKLISEGRVAEDNVVKSSFILLLSYTFFVFIVFFVSASFLSDFFMGGLWREALIIIPLAAFFLGVNSLFVSYYNGRQDYRRYLFYSVLLSLFTALLTVLFAYYFQRDGAIYSVVIAPIGASLLILFFFRGWMHNRRLICFAEFLPIATTLVQFFLMAVGSAIVVYGGQIYLRYFIMDNLSEAAAGIWYSATRLSEIYIGISSVLFSAILVPRYAVLSGKFLASEVMRMFLLAVGFALVMVLSVTVMSDWVVHIIYGPAFDLASEILDLYVIGDAIKVLSWVFLYVFIARQKVLFYLTYEIFSAVVYVVFSILAFRYLDFKYMAVGYVVQVALSLLIVMYGFFRFSNASTASHEKVND